MTKTMLEEINWVDMKSGDARYHDVPLGHLVTIDGKVGFDDRDLAALRNQINFTILAGNTIPLSFLDRVWLVQHNRLSVMGGLLLGTYFKGSKYRFLDTFAISPDGELERADYSPYTLPVGVAKDRHDIQYTTFSVRPLWLDPYNRAHDALIEQWQRWLWESQVVTEIKQITVSESRKWLRGD